MTADSIRELRNRLGLTQEQFARQLEAKALTVASWEQGKRQPGREMAQRLECLDEMNPCAGAVWQMVPKGKSKNS